MFDIFSNITLSQQAQSPADHRTSLGVVEWLVEQFHSLTFDLTAPKIQRDSLKRTLVPRLLVPVPEANAFERSSTAVRKPVDDRFLSIARQFRVDPAIGF